MKIKKNDQVLVISGKDRGKTGKVDKILPKTNQALVVGINLAKKSVKPSKKSPKGGQIELVKPIDISNLKYMCPDCNKPAKIFVKEDSRGNKIRICKNCQNKKTDNTFSKDKSKNKK